MGTTMNHQWNEKSRQPNRMQQQNRANQANQANPVNQNEY